MGTGENAKNRPNHGDPESRRYPRIPGQIPVTIQRFALPGQEETVLKVSGQNISRGGICISTSHPYPERAMVRLEIHLMGWERYSTPSAFAQGEKNGHLQALGQVVWCRPTPGGRRHEIGIRFVDIEETKYRALMAYLKNLEAS